MASAPNIYAADPAFPTLAHTLLTDTDSKVEDAEHASSDAVNDDWNLQEDWNAGIQSKSKIFRSGTVIGFSRLRMNSHDSNEYIGQIPRHLLTTHLLKTPSPSETTAFVVHPNNFDAFAPVTLLKDLQSARGLPTLSREDAIRRLDSVQLLPVFDLQHASQAIAKVSELLQKAREERRQSTDNQPVVLFVAGLDTLAEGVIRNSNPAKGTVVLAAILRNLTRMSRSHGSYLSVILVNTNGLGSVHGPQSESTDQSKAQGGDSNPSRDDGIHSIFQTPGSSLLSTLLMRTLDQGIDTHILLSEVNSVTVAEVIKDRTGSGLGKWGIWSSTQ